MVKGESQSGMLFFARNGEHYLINATYPMDDEIMQMVEAVLKDLKEKQEEEIQDDYQHNLKMATQEGKNPPELEFLQLIVVCESWDYEFYRPEGLPVELIFQVVI
jgi:hypothetical protein